MCLDRDIKENPLKLAEEDIVCYKGVQIPYEEWFKIKTWILRKLKRFKNYKTYFSDDSIVIGRVFVAEPVLSKEELDRCDKEDFSIEAGFIHSFKNLKDAREFAKRRNYIDVVKCIIPAGTYYFEGLNHDFTEGYASTQIKYIKVI